MRIFEIVLPREEIEPGIVYDAEKHEIAIRPQGDAEPRLTLKALNRMKTMRAAARVAGDAEKRLLTLMYRRPDAPKRRKHAR